MGLLQVVPRGQNRLNSGGGYIATKGNKTGKDGGKENSQEQRQGQGHLSCTKKTRHMPDKQRCGTE